MIIQLKQTKKKKDFKPKLLWGNFTIYVSLLYMRIPSRFNILK